MDAFIGPCRRKNQWKAGSEYLLVDDFDEVSKEYDQHPPEYYGKRHIFALLSFLGVGIVYSFKVNLSVAIVAMVKTNGSSLKTLPNNFSNLEDECPFHIQDHEKKALDGDFEWDEEVQGTILGAFFYGYVITQLPAGYFSEKIGGKWIFGLGNGLAGLLTVLAPWMATLGQEYFIANRILVGLCCGVIFPALTLMMARWISIQERATIGGFILAGMQAGTFFTLPISGILADSFGWESVFYGTGSAGLLWFIFWMVLTTNTPEEHSTIRKEELMYLRLNTGRADDKDKPFPPLFSIFTSVPLLALTAAHWGANWGTLTLLTEIPTYLSEIQHFSLKANGFLSSLPYLCFWVFANIYGRFNDYLIAKNYVTTTAGRKLGNSIGFMIPAFCLISVAYVGCSQAGAIAWLCICVGINGSMYSGYMINHMDLSPNYAGTLMGITNTVANFTGFLAPMFVGIVTKGNQTMAAWRVVFFVSSGTYVITNLIYVLFGSGETQPWNEIGQKKRENSS